MNNKYKKIPSFSKGKKYTILVSEKDYKKISKKRWYICNGYAATNKSPKDGKFIKLHQLIMGKRKNMDIDHINENKLDNRRENLRFVSTLQNMNNNFRRKITIRKRVNRWEANITLNYRFVRGSFKTKLEAVKWRSRLKKLFWTHIMSNKNPEIFFKKTEILNLINNK